MRGHNEGSIKERKDGRFEIRVTAGYDFKTGRSKRISYYANTKAEAVKKLHEEEYNIHFNKHVDPTSTKLIDWLHVWLEKYMKNSLKQYIRAEQRCLLNALKTYKSLLLRGKIQK